MHGLILPESSGAAKTYVSGVSKEVTGFDVPAVTGIKSTTKMISRKVQALFRHIWQYQ